MLLYLEEFYCSQVLGMDVDLSDEEQMMRAIALSLGEAEKPQADEVTVTGFAIFHGLLCCTFHC